MAHTKENFSGYTRRLAFLGTGPLSLLKALFIARKEPGTEIVLFDSAPRIGGAWYSDLSPEGREIECGCHIWSYVPTAYRYIEKDLGVPLYNMKPNPVFIEHKLRVPYSVKNSVDTYGAFSKTLFTGRWSQFKNFRQDPNMNFRLVGKRNKYPKNGSPELVHALRRELEKYPNIRLQLNTNIESISIHEKVKLQFENDWLEFDHIYLTYVSRLGEVKIQGNLLEVETRHVDYIHFLIRLNKAPLKNATYWRLMKDPIIHRITDIRYQTDGKEILLLVGIKDKAYHANSETNLLAHVEQVMKTYKLIDASHQLELIKTHIFPTYYLSEKTLEGLKSVPDKVSLMHTTDLMHGFHFILQEEKIIG